MPSLLLLPGDGIGPEVIEQVRRVSAWMAARGNFHLELTERAFGGASYAAHGTPLPLEAEQSALASDAVRMGAVGGPQWASVARGDRPEAGLLRLRKAMDAVANLRPAICFEALADASSLKREFVAGLDIQIVRELTSGVYFGEPRGIEVLEDGFRCGGDTQVY